MRLGCCVEGKSDRITTSGLGSCHKERRSIQEYRECYFILYILIREAITLLLNNHNIKLMT